MNYVPVTTILSVVDKVIKVSDAYLVTGVSEEDEGTEEMNESTKC